MIDGEIGKDRHHHHHRGKLQKDDKMSTNKFAQPSPRMMMGTTTTRKISTTIRGAELLCCCCSCSTATSAKSPGLLASLGVCLLVFGYTLLGAFAFMALEGAGFKGFEGKSSTRQLGEDHKQQTILGNGSSLGQGSMTTEVSTNSGNGRRQKFNGDPETGDDIEDEIPNNEILVEDFSTRQLRAYTVERLWSITEDLNVLYKENWTRLAEREVLDFQEKMAQHSLDRARSASTIYGTLQRPGAPPGTVVVSRRANNRSSSSSSALENRRRWTFGSSFLYSITLITTIGYGSTSPRTMWGRIITIAYALAGIPLMLVYLSTIGDVLARTFRRLYARICGSRVECMRQSPGIIEKKGHHRYDNHIDTKLTPHHHQFYSSKSSDDLTSAYQDSKRQHHHFYPCNSETSAVCLVRIPISLCLLIILLYICCGAVMFNRLEGWSLLEGSYFCFTSLGTIGFGDLVPSGGNASTHILEELSLCACSVYILAGMGLIAMCFNLMQDEVVRVVRVFGRTCVSTNSNGTNPPSGKSPMNRCHEDHNIDEDEIPDS